MNLVGILPKTVKSVLGIIAVTGSLVAASPVEAQDVRITKDTMQFEYDFMGKTYVIQRNQDQKAVISGKYAKTSRPCPPACVQPMSVHEGVTTVGELEVMEFLKDYVTSGKGFLIDSRTKERNREGTIPGAVSLPFNVFVPGPKNAFFDPMMQMLGGEKSASGEWIFTDPKDLLLFCEGPWCPQSPKAIRNLIAINYPPEKLHWYRGGMQNWVGMGFVTEIPK